MGFKKEKAAKTVSMDKINCDLSVQLLEYDKRFEHYGSEFTFYDYNQPVELPSTMQHGYKIVVADPPYLLIHCVS
ncbi:hypothetical protein RJ639_006617 [Escallonia herrerae]|uniref:Uncharacterized protein n=1 Tax=Escallonia herrerae TaxID=1293975 RepID=A0AA88VX51_9ASTE|nr:hypothetical protein RJ639_006617 [Escallonia herrerae]